MNQFVYTLILASVFSSLGLISCSPDHSRTVDSFKVSPPKIIRAGQTESNSDLKQLDQEKTRELDLRDLIDASSGQPARVKTRVRCRADQISVEVSRITPTSKFRVLQVVPEELLIQELEKTPFLCNFEIAVQNDVGSSHIFNLADVHLTDRQKNELQVTNYSDEPAKEPFFLNAENAQGLKVSFKYDKPVTGQILCEDLHYEPVPFQSTWELKSFNERRYFPHKTQGTGLAIEKSPQRCRILISLKDSPIALSSFFRVIIPRPPFELEARDVGVSAVNDQGFKQTEPVMTDFVYRNKPYVMMEYKLKNREAVRRWIRLPRKPRPVQIRSLYCCKNQFTWASKVFSPNWLYITAPGAAAVEADDNFETLPIEPQSELVLRLMIAPPGPMNCIGSTIGTLFGLYIEPPTSPIEIKESGAGPHSTLVDGFFLPGPRPIYALSADRGLYLNSQGYEDSNLSPCRWP